MGMAFLVRRIITEAADEPETPQQDLYLYNRGVIDETTTGGWVDKKAEHGTITWGEDNVLLTYWSDDSETYASIYTTKAIDITQYNKLVVVATYVGRLASTRYVSVGVTTTPYTGVNITTGTNSLAAVTKINTTGYTEESFEVDLSSLSGEYYVQILHLGYKIRIHEIYLAV